MPCAPKIPPSNPPAGKDERCRLYGLPTVSEAAGGVERDSGGVPAVAAVEAGVEAELPPELLVVSLRSAVLDLRKGDLRAEAGSLGRGSAECWRFNCEM